MTMRTTKKRQLHPGDSGVELGGSRGSRQPTDGRRGRSRAMSTRKGTNLTNQRLNQGLRLALALGVALLLGAAEQAQAQTTVTTTTTKNQSFQQDITDPCTSETVRVQGTEDTTFQSTQDATRFQSKVDDRTQGSGVGLTTGAQYSFSNFVRNTFKSSTSTFTVRFTLREHLFRDGNTPPPQKDDFFLRIRSRIDFVNGTPNGPTIESFTTETCK
jgi:hypothetical protein